MANGRQNADKLPSNESSALPWISRTWMMMKENFLQKLHARHLPTDLPLPSLKNISCIVTGATSGIGLHTARGLAMAGAHVVMACRNDRAAEELIQEWQVKQNQLGGPALSIEVMKLDLGSLASVRSFAASWEARQVPLHILINNAGVLLMGVPQKRLTVDGYEEHMQVNHLAPALLTILLLPSLTRGAPSRIVNVSSMAHHFTKVDPEDLNYESGRKTYHYFVAYGGSKLAQLMFSAVLQRKLPTNSAIDVIAVHPGSVATNITRTLPAWVQPFLKIGSFFRFSPKEAARSVLFCAVDGGVKEHAKKLRQGGCRMCAYYLYSCEEGEVATHALDFDIATRVWQKTLELVGLPHVVDICVEDKAHHNYTF